MTDLEQKPRLGEMSFRFIGKPLVRKEDARLTTGRGRFSDDFSLPGQVHAVMVRSPHPHARIRGVETARAKAMPGVLGVYTGADLTQYGTLKCIVPFNNRDGSPMIKPPRPALPVVPAAPPAAPPVPQP